MDFSVHHDHVDVKVSVVVRGLWFYTHGCDTKFELKTDHSYVFNVFIVQTILNHTLMYKKGKNNKAYVCY